LQHHADGDTAPAAGVVSLLLARPGAWPAAVVADAEAAYQAALRSARPAPPRRAEERDRIRVGHGVVRAACGAVEAGVVFVGFEDGSIARFDPRDGSLLRLPGRYGGVIDLATDPQGRVCVAVHAQPEVMAQLVRYEFDGATARARESRSLPHSEAFRLVAPLAWRGEETCGVWCGGALELLAGPEMLPVDSVSITAPDHLGYVGALLIPWPCDSAEVQELVALVVGEGSAAVWPITDDWEVEPDDFPIAEPVARARQTFAARAFVSGAMVHVWALTLDGDGRCLWVDARNDGPFLRVRSSCASKEHGFLCAAILSPGKIAAVEPQGVAWLRTGPNNALTAHGTTRIALANAVACFASPTTNELLVVSRDGFVTRVPMPR
jgi:hypothetical protein